MFLRRIATFAVALLVSTALATLAHGQTLADYTFDHLDGVAPAGVPDNGVRAEDESGNRYHGFYGGGTNNTPARLDGVSVGQETPTGTPGLDFGVNTTGSVILRDGLADGTSNFAFGAGATPSPYYTIGTTDSWTIESVLNFQTAGDNEAIIANNASGVPEWWWRTENSGGTVGLQFMFTDGNVADRAFDVHLTDAILDDLWHHVALVFDRDPDGDGIDADDGEVRTFVDQMLVGTTPFDPVALGVVGDGTRDIEIGRFDGGAGVPNFGGFMDRLVITQSALGPGSFAAVQAVPEPASILLWSLLGSITALLLWRRHKRG